MEEEYGWGHVDYMSPRTKGYFTSPPASNTQTSSHLSESPHAPFHVIIVQIAMLFRHPPLDPH